MEWGCSEDLPERKVSSTTEKQNGPRGDTGDRDHVQHGAENGCSMVIKAPSAKETFKKPNTVNIVKSKGNYSLHARILKGRAHGIHTQQKGFLRNASK